MWSVTSAVTLRGGGGVFRQAPGLEPLGRTLPAQALIREGIEAALERRHADRWSGWLSYNWGRLAYDDALTGERFDADFDQRHSASAYLRVRFSPQTIVSVRVRAASNFPIPGYWEVRDGVDYLGDTRNQLRLPVYARCDAPANHTFHRGRTRLTLFAEVLNVLDRENLRAADPSVNRRTRVARGLTGELFPLLPSAGVLIEF